MGTMLKKRSEIEEKYKWNLDDMIPSEEALENYIKEAEERIASYESYKGHLGESAKKLAEFLKFDVELDEIFSRLFSYARQKSDEDTAVGEYQALLSKVGTLSTKAMEASSFAEPEILEIPEEKMNQFLKTEELAHYKLMLNRLLAKKEHMLSEAEETILSAVSEVAQAPDKIFRLFNIADFCFPVI